MSRRIFSVILALCLLAGLSPPRAWATSAASDGDSAKIGDDNLAWRLSNGELTISIIEGESGNGVMADFSASFPPPWYEYRNDITSIVMESGVTVIGSYAFAECEAATSVTILDSVTSIGEGAFSECSGLTDVYYGGTIAKWNAISIASNNEPLTNAAIHYDNNEDGQIDATDALSGTCGDNLTWTLADGVLTISGTGPMENYYKSDAPWYDSRESITTVIIESGVSTIGAQAFSGCSGLINLTIPNSVSSIGDWAFEYCYSLVSLTIPNNVTSIGDRAFYNCRVLTNATIPEGITTIRAHTFGGCVGLTNVTIPASVTTISASAFAYCSTLADVYYGGTETQWNAVTIDDTYNENAALHSATIHFAGSDAVTECHVFFEANGGSGEMPEVTVTPDSSGALEYVLPQCAFTPPEGSRFRIWQCTMYDAESNTTVTEANVGETLDLRGAVSLGLTALWESAVPDCTVTFYGNGGLPQSSAYVVEMNTAVPRPQTDPTREGYEFIGWFADAEATTLFDFDAKIVADTSIYAGWKERVSNVLASGYCGGEDDGTNLSWVLTNDGVLTVSGSGAMADYAENSFAPWYEYRENITTIIMENGVTSVGVMAFFDCTALTSVTIPEGITSIDSFSFEGCEKLASVAIPNGITYIGQYAFIECGSLTSITIPNSIIGIIHGAFAGTNLVDVYYNGTQAQWRTVTVYEQNEPLLNATIHCTDGDIVNGLDSGILGRGYCGAESGGMNLSWVLTADGVLTVSGSGAMADYSASSVAPWYGNRGDIATVVLESGVSSVGGYAFRDCGKLTAVKIANTLSYVVSSAFSACDALDEAYYDGSQEQWDNVTIGEDNDALEFAAISCAGETYNQFRSLNRFGRDGKMDDFKEQEWRLAAPLSKFRGMTSDREGLTIDGVPLKRVNEFTRQEGSMEYTAEAGSTLLTIPAETFATFEEGSHNITAEFSTKPNPRNPADDGTRKTSEVYTIFPEGDITIDASEIVGDDASKAVEDVSYTSRFQTTPHLSDKFYRFEILNAKFDGSALNISTVDGGEATLEEEGNKVQRIGNQEFFFHENGRFSGVPTVPGEYEFTVLLQVREETYSEWYDSERQTVTLIVEAKTAQNVETASDGYELVRRADALIEEGNLYRMVSKGAYDEFIDFYIDGVRQIRGVDYDVYPYYIDPDTNELIRPLDGGAITGTYLASKQNSLGLGLHNLNLEFKHVDPLGNTQTQNVSQGVTVTRKAAPVSYGGGGGGGGGGSSAPLTYAVTASKASNGKISLSATKVAAGKTVTITVTPNSGYQIGGVSVTDSKKNSVSVSRNGNQYAFTMPKRAVTVSATFTPSSYGVSANSAQHGKITLDKSSATSGATVNGSTTPDKGYLLSAVTVRDADGKSVKAETFDNGKFTFLMPSGKATVSATFTVKRLASFVDIQGPDWFFDDAEWAYNRGIIQGTTPQYWEPQSLMSSITSIVTLERLDGVDLTPYDTGADDGLDNSAWYVAALRWANANNITLADRPFGGQNALTRGEFAVMLSNYLRYRGLNVAAPADLTFTDAASMTPDELNAFLILQEADVFRGYSDGSIRPKAYLSRAHLSALLHRLSAYIIQAESGNI